MLELLTPRTFPALSKAYGNPKCSVVQTSNLHGNAAVRGGGGCSSGTDTECACQTHSCLAILRKLKIRLKRGLKSLVSLLKFKRKLCRKTRALLFVLLLPCLFCLQNWATYQRRNCSWQTVILRNCRVHWGDRGWRVARNWAADPHPVPLPSAMESRARI